LRAIAGTATGKFQSQTVRSSNQYQCLVCSLSTYQLEQDSSPAATNPAFLAFDTDCSPTPTRSFLASRELGRDKCCLMNGDAEVVTGKASQERVIVPGTFTPTNPQEFRHAFP
jgi:hypothetical protein